MRGYATWIIAPRKLSVLQKEFNVRFLSNFNEIYLVNEYPKSGGTWLKLMLSEALQLPAWTKNDPQWGSCVMQAHWLKPRTRCRTIALFRDGRDVMVSLYYHSFFRNEFQNAEYTEYMKEKFNFSDLNDIRSNLLPFMQVVFDTPISPAFSWSDFASNWLGRDDVVVCTYEELRSDTVRTLQRLVRELTKRNLNYDAAKAIVDKYTMDNMRKRLVHATDAEQKNNVEVSFMRKGAVSGWSHAFSDEALDWFEHRAGAALDMLGYPRGRPLLTTEQK